MNVKGPGNNNLVYSVGAVMLGFIVPLACVASVFVGRSADSKHFSRGKKSENTWNVQKNLRKRLLRRLSFISFKVR